MDAIVVHHPRAKYFDPRFDYFALNVRSDQTELWHIAAVAPSADDFLRIWLRSCFGNSGWNTGLFTYGLEPIWPILDHISYHE